MTRRAWIALLLAFTLAGCGSAAPGAPPDNPVITLGQEFRVAAGHTATLSPDNLRVVFNGVGEDSRCPSGVQCAWAGRAIVQISVYPGLAKAVGYNLIMGSSKQGDDTASFGLYVIRARALYPVPTDGAATRPGDYVATLLLTKK